MSNAIETSGLAKIFDTTRALDGVDLRIREGSALPPYRLTATVRRLLAPSCFLAWYGHVRPIQKSGQLGREVTLFRLLGRIGNR